MIFVTSKTKNSLVRTFSPTQIFHNFFRNKNNPCHTERHPCPRHSRPLSATVKNGLHDSQERPARQSSTACTTVTHSPLDNPHSAHRLHFCDASGSCTPRVGSAVAAEPMRSTPRSRSVAPQNPLRTANKTNWDFPPMKVRVSSDETPSLLGGNSEATFSVWPGPSGAYSQVDSDNRFSWILCFWVVHTHFRRRVPFPVKPQS